MHDALYADQGRHDDPHLWERAERSASTSTRFEADRRAAGAVARACSATSAAALRAGVAATPTLVVGGALHAGARRRVADRYWATMARFGYRSTRYTGAPNTDGRARREGTTSYGFQ